MMLPYERIVKEHGKIKTPLPNTISQLFYNIDNRDVRFIIELQASNFFRRKIVKSNSVIILPFLLLKRNKEISRKKKKRDKIQ